MVMERFDLTGKVIVITGAARGLGKQMTLALAKAGADVLVADMLDRAERADRRARCAPSGVVPRP